MTLTVVLLAAGLTGATLAGCAGAAASRVAPPGPVEVSGVDGRLFQPLAPAPGTRANAVVFITTDCPIANSYAPDLRALAAEFSSRGVTFFLVHVDPDVSAAKAKEHASDLSLPGTILLDPRHLLVDRIGATRTPEAAVILPGGALAYRGRIDDRYADIGVRRHEVRSQDLRAALEAVLTSRPVAAPRTEPVGCSISDLRSPP